MGILQARILEWFAMSSSRGSSQPRDQTQVSHIASGFFTIWATFQPCSDSYSHTWGMVAGYWRDQGTASHEGKDEMHPVPQACMKFAGDADLVIEAVELGRVTYAREAVTQLVGSPKQIRRDTRMELVVSFPCRYNRGSVFSSADIWKCSFWYLSVTQENKVKN